MASATTAGMDKLIAKVNELQDHVSKSGLPPMALNLPQMVVVGAQSAGKSSVLENFVGRSFLPRGGDIVTRRPLVLQMVYDVKEEYGRFGHTGNKKFSLSEICNEIKAETDRVAPGQSVSSGPISLRIHSPHVLNFTLVDLPGLTQVAVGNQPADIKQKIRNMVLQYAQQSNALILAVTPANIDLATSVALNLAEEVDPEGVRTISVITKIDRMDAAENASAILSNRTYKLKLGHWGVINTSRDAEKKFFAKNAAYHERDVARQCGTENLQAALVAQLGAHIRERLPKLREELRGKLSAMEPKIIEHRKHETATDTLESKYERLQAMMQQLASAFESNIVDGNSSSNDNGASDDFDEVTLNGGARICNIFRITLAKNLRQISSDGGGDDDNEELNEKIAVSICNSNGIRPVVGPDPKAFEKLVKRRIKMMMQSPCAHCVDDVAEELQKTFADVLGASSCSINRYPALRAEIQRRIRSYMKEREAKTKEAIKEFVQMQTEYINTENENFEKNVAKEVLKPPIGALKAAKKTKFDFQHLTPHIDKVRLMKDSYMKLMTDNLCDNIPKYVVGKLVNEMVRYVKVKLISELMTAVTCEDSRKRKKTATAAAAAADTRTRSSSKKATTTTTSNKNNEEGEWDDDDDETEEDGALGLMVEHEDAVKNRKADLSLYNAIGTALRIAEKELPL